ncbi:hypothetical protein OSB04_006531 [Centaurea solstitialis]|uniref:Integrase catalytic domain-containing protein n=1 Tax=Centaurea solstitialis TaxID=347529 RepID=A0AA38TTN3_9ASTR|nr:hypothetical protein OSB04_006531 [Centaurea solstitialis]
MTKEGSESSGLATGNAQNAPYTDNSSLVITNHKLDGKNFLQWSQSVLMVIRGRGKLGYLTGEIPRPTQTDKQYPTWELNNSIAVKETYSDLGNASQVFEIKMKLKDMRQGASEVTHYYNCLKVLWQELDMFYEADWGEVEEHVKFKAHLEKERLYDFLAGLNRDLDEVRGRVLGRTPLPSIGEAFAEVRREENRRRVMLGEQKEAKPITSSGDRALENSALIAKGPPTFKARSGGENKPGDRGDRGWCTHCNRAGHIREKCFKLHGYPGTNKNQPMAKAHHTATEPVLGTKSTQDEVVTVQLSKTQLETLHQLLSKPIHGMTLNVFTKIDGDIQWIFDSGATNHMTGNSSLFHTYIPCHNRSRVRIADGSFSAVAGRGSVRLSKQLTLKKVLHVPKLTCNLLSIRKLTKDAKCLAQFSPFDCLLQEQGSGRMIGNAKVRDGLYIWENHDSKNKQAYSTSTSSSSSRDTILMWHRRLGHPNFKYLKYLFPKLFRNENTSSILCEICQLSKHTRVPYPLRPYVSSKPFSLIHSDIWGPSRIKNISGSKWFITFIDDHTRVCWVYLLTDKSEASNTFKIFHTMVQNQFQTTIHTLRTDNGREYFNSSLGTYLSDHGIIHQSSCPNTPQQNGISERKNRHLLEVARALMFTMHIPKYLWGEAVLTACYLINRLPSKVLEFQTPVAVLKTEFPLFQVSSLQPKIFGCKAFVHSHNPGQSKLDPREQKCVFIGYSSTQKGYKCYSPTMRRVFVSKDVTFFESEPYFSPTHLQGEKLSEDESLNGLLDLEQDVIPTQTDIPLPILDIPEIQPLTPENPLPQQSPEMLVYSRRHNSNRIEKSKTQNCHDSALENCSEEGQESAAIDVNNDEDLPIALRKGSRSCTKHPISSFLAYGKLSPTYRAFVTNIDQVATPRNVEEALASPTWKIAVCEELTALEKNGTWELTNLPSGKKTVGSKWLFTIKYNSDGSVNRHKARLVAKGYTQTHGIDYQETFAPVAKLNTVRVLLSLAANLDWPLMQLDVKNAFLNGELSEEVYMDFPPGFENPEGKVCRLKKSLYGLKQSPRAWFSRFTQAVTSRGYSQGQTDHTMFFKHSKNGKIAILIVYVDDIIMTGDDLDEINKLKAYLSLEFEMKDLGALKYFLGMEVARNQEGISVSQRKYVLDLLTETGMMGCRPANTPMEFNKKLGTKDDGAAVDRERYQRLVGKLIYLSHTRPDISFVVSVISQFMHSPKERHLEAVYRVLRYLKGTPGKGLHFKKGENRCIEVFTDADYAGAANDGRSTSGYLSYVWGNLVTWRSKKQSVVSRSSAESEFRAVANGTCEGIWLRRLLEELRVPFEAPIKLYCDNKAAISIAQNPVHHDRTKHVEVDRHFIKEKLDSGSMCMVYLPSKQQVADLLTKSLTKKLFDDLTNKLGMINIYMPA